MALQETLKAISDPVRRKILVSLREKELSAGEIAQLLQMTPPVTPNTHSLRAYTVAFRLASAFNISVFSGKSKIIDILPFVKPHFLSPRFFNIFFKLTARIFKV